MKAKCEASQCQWRDCEHLSKVVLIQDHLDHGGFFPVYYCSYHGRLAYRSHALNKTPWTKLVTIKEFEILKIKAKL